MTNAQKLENRGVKVPDVDGMLRDVEAEVIGGAMRDARPHTAAGKPQGEAAGMMVASRLDGIPLALAHDAAAELAAPDDEGLVQQIGRAHV